MYPYQSLISGRPTFWSDGEQVPPPAPVPPASAKTDDGKITFDEKQQSHINKLVGDARGDGRKTATAELLARYGVQDEKELEAKLTELQKVKDAQLSEQQRVQKEADDAKAKADEKLKQAAERERLANQRLVRAALVADMDARFLSDARTEILAYIESNQELSDMLKLDGDTVTGTKEVLNKVAETKKFFLVPAVVDNKDDKGRVIVGTPSPTNGRPATPPAKVNGKPLPRY